MTNPLYDPYAVLHSVYGGGAYLKQALSDTPIEELNRARTAKICYGVMENDLFLDFCIRSFAPKNPKLPVRILLKIALYMLVFLKKPRYMVTDNAVSLLKKLGKGGAAGFVNAFLRAFDEQKLVFPKEGTAALSVRFSFPEFAVRRIVAAYGKDAEAVLSPRPARTFVRYVCENVRPGGEETPFAGLYSYPSFRREEGYDLGEYTFQSIGSVAICAGVSPCEKLLDACAAPGGKSVLLSEKCGLVTAFELHAHRAKLIEQYASRMHRDNVRVFCRDASVFDPEFEGTFDAVLADVPCSGYGVVGENPDIKFFRKEEDLSALCAAQLSILETVSRYVRKGGDLYYSTCSVFPEENDGTVGQFLARVHGFSVREADSPLPFRRTRYGIQFLPHLSMGAGFYFAHLVREE